MRIHSCDSTINSEEICEAAFHKFSEHAWRSFLSLRDPAGATARGRATRELVSHESGQVAGVKYFE
jgi:hypothetical protein